VYREQIGRMLMISSYQQGASSIVLIAQPQDKLPIISKRALKQGRIEEGKTIGIWLTDIGKYLWDTSLSMDSNARINLEKHFNPNNWTIRIDTIYFSFRFSLKQYYVPMKVKGMEPCAIKIEFPIQSGPVTESMRRFLANYNAPPYNFTKIPSLEKTYNTYYETIQNNWDLYFSQRYPAAPKPMYDHKQAYVDPKKQAKVGDWFKGSKVIKWIPNAVLIIILSAFIVGPLISYTYFGDDMEIFLFSTILQLLYAGIMFVFVAFPFRSLWNNYRIGFDVRMYEKLSEDTFRNALKEILRDLNIKYSIQEKFLISKVFRQRVTLITLNRGDLKIMFRKSPMGLNDSMITVSIGKVDELNERLVLDFEKRLDEKLVSYIRTMPY
jgi:hypothetical protein